jgi:hypothetical protein
MVKSIASRVQGTEALQHDGLCSASVVILELRNCRPLLLVSLQLLLLPESCSDC